jgi:hypothetical protein
VPDHRGRAVVAGADAVALDGGDRQSLRRHRGQPTGHWRRCDCDRRCMRCTRAMCCWIQCGDHHPQPAALCGGLEHLRPRKAQAPSKLKPTRPWTPWRSSVSTPAGRPAALRCVSGGRRRHDTPPRRRKYNTPHGTAVPSHSVGARTLYRLNVLRTKFSYVSLEKTCTSAQLSVFEYVVGMQ